MNMEEETKNIGDEGKSINFSRASRAAYITPDLKRLAKYDEYPVKIRKLKLKKLFWLISFVVIMVKLILQGYVWWSILPGILALWNLFRFIIYRSVSPQIVYESGLLCGAVITSENPLQIAVMAEMQTSEDAPTCFGIQCFNVKELPLHKIEKGERVPCSVMFGGEMPFAKLWSLMEPHPTCWATADISLLIAATKAIDETEWEIIGQLAELAAKRQDVDYSKKIAYFNDDFSPRIDLQE